MRFGLSVYDVTAAELADLAVAAEAAGFESLWLGEHLLMPVGYTSVHPTREPEQELAAPIVGPDTQLTDPLVALAAAAARTSRTPAWHRHLPAGAAPPARGGQGGTDAARAFCWPAALRRRRGLAAG